MGLIDLEKIKITIEKIRPQIQSHGGDLEFVSYKNGIVYVRLQGACISCPISFYTLKYGIEVEIRAACSEVLRVDLVSD